MDAMDFRGHFVCLADAMERENQILSIGDEFLPFCAREVRDGGVDTPEYWAWLISQIDCEHYSALWEVR